MSICAGYDSVLMYSPLGLYVGLSPLSSQTGAAWAAVGPCYQAGRPAQATSKASTFEIFNSQSTRMSFKYKSPVWGQHPCRIIAFYASLVHVHWISVTSIYLLLGRSNLSIETEKSLETYRTFLVFPFLFYSIQILSQPSLLGYQQVACRR